MGDGSFWQAGRPTAFPVGHQSMKLQYFQHNIPGLGKHSWIYRGKDHYLYTSRPSGGAKAFFTFALLCRRSTSSTTASLRERSGGASSPIASWACCGKTTAASGPGSCACRSSAAFTWSSEGPRQTRPVQARPDLPAARRHDGGE